MIFAISMDYTVFLLSSAKEHWDRSHDAKDAAVGGLAHSGRVIFAAAAVMVAVFFTFALSGPLPPKEMGVILGLAVLLDAMLVRLVLIPTLLRVFGRCEDYPRHQQASRFLREVRPQLRRLLIRRARMHPYIVNHVIRTAIQRARLLNLRLKHRQRDTKREALGMLERMMLDMLLRDRETGTNIHRDGSHGNHYVEEMTSLSQAYTQAGVLETIARSAAAFDMMASRWTPDYRPCRQPMLNMMAKARQNISNEERSEFSDSAKIEKV
jgi:hypothetical protein